METSCPRSSSISVYYWLESFSKDSVADHVLVKFTTFFFMMVNLILETGDGVNNVLIVTEMGGGGRVIVEDFVKQVRHFVVEEEIGELLWVDTRREGGR
jgi:hypothetical protein